MTDDIATPTVEDHRSWRPSLVWLAPLIALAISLGIAWKTWADKGPMIEVVLSDAAGIEARKTSLKHKNVEVGVVEDVGFTDDLKDVLVSVRVDKDVARYIDDTAQFWVVRPQVSARGITGLDTVLSGPYIEVAWDAETGARQRRFTALEQVPLSAPGDKGIRIKLRANDGGSMVVGAPVLYKRIEVGKIESKELSPDGERVDFTLFVNAPHNDLLTTATRFWQLSGVAVEIGADGAKLKVDSLASLLQGGISFDTVATSGAPIEPTQAFVLYDNEANARRSVFNDSPGSQIRLSVEFESSVRGLKIGAPVEYRGLRVGEVTDVAAKVKTEDGITDISLIVTMTLQPSRLGLRDIEGDETLRFLKRAVARGLRAKLASASLLTGALYVELVEQPDADVALLDELAEPYPRLPSVPSDFEDFTASAEGVLNRINALPVEKLLFSANELLDNLNALASAEGTTAVPQEVAALLRDARALVNDPELRKAPDDLAATLASARNLMEQVEKAGAAEALTQALKDASAAAEAVTTAAAGVPAMLTTMTAASSTISELPLDDLIKQATVLIEDVDKIAKADGITEIPTNLNQSLDAVRVLLTDLRKADAAKELSQTLVAAREAAVSINTAAKDAPKIVARLDAITAEVDALPLDGLIASANTLLKDLDAIATADGIREIPDNLNESLQSIRLLLGDLRDADAAKNLSESLKAARDAATSINTAVADAPKLIARFEGIAGNVEELPLDELIAAARKLIDDADRIVADEGLQAAPKALGDTLETARALLTDLREAGAAQKLADALVAAQGAAQSVTGTMNQTPALIQRLSALADKAGALPLENLVSSATALVQDADRIMRAPGAEQMPGALTAALDEVRTAVNELRQRGTIDNFNATMASFNEASLSFTQLSSTLQVLMPKLERVAANADSVLSSFDVGSELNYEAVTALREMRDAARAITALAASVERRPNSLILGK